MKTLLAVACGCVIFLASVVCAASQEKELFATHFEQQPAAGWKYVSGKWDAHDGHMSQVDTSNRDPKKAILDAVSKDESSGDVVIVAKLRIDSWKAADSARTGIGVCTNPTNGRGLNLVFHDRKLRFLHDYVAWGPGCDFDYQPGKWYWMKLYRQAAARGAKEWIDEGLEPSILRGKAWADGEQEPSQWMISWFAHDDVGAGYPSLNGGSGPVQVSFAEFRVFKVEPPKAAKTEIADINLNGAWQVRPAPMKSIGLTGLAETQQASDGWLTAQVPGEVHLDLIQAGQLPEPTVGTNMPKCRWPETKSWWYKTKFVLPDAFLRNEQQNLIFDGLDLYAQVFLNDKLLGESKDAFVPAVFDARKLLRSGHNELVVRMTAGSELSRDPAAAGGKIPNPDKRHWEGRRWLRKPAFEYGWDWVDALPNIGIWRGVRLEGRRHVVIDDLRLDTVRRDGRVFVELEAVLENLHWRSGRACIFDLEIHPPEGGAPITRRYPIDLAPGRAPVRDLIEIPNAKLWWPNGMGAQPLYRVVARTGNAVGAPCDRREFSIGLRTVEVDRSRLAAGARFCFRVNGEEVFCRGGNLGPHDPILARISDEKYRQLVSEARDAHLNMLRVNGCSIFEGPAFYDACDRAGILVYQDFMFTDLTYPEDPEFVAASRAETESAVRMLRHHPSIALWAGNNENTMLFSAAPGYGEKLYNQIFPELCLRIDPARRPYWQGSPAGGKDPNSEMIGDCHWWSGGWMNRDVNQRISPAVYDNCRARFVSEYGVIGPCHLDSMREYLPADEMSPGTPSWTMHTNAYERKTLGAAIRWHYADPEGLSVEEYSKYGQMFQAIMHGSAIEAMRFRKQDPADDCAGILMWSYSDCWGETGWSILDYYLRRKASYYATRRACAPVKVIVRLRGDRYVTRIVNDTLEPVERVVEFGWHGLDGAKREVQSRPIKLGPNSMLEIASVKAPPTNDRDTREWVYAAVLRNLDGVAADQSLCLQLPSRRLTRPKPQIKTAKISDDVLEISSPTYAHGVHVDDHGHEMISDNWFDLLPGVPVRVKLATGVKPESIRLETVEPK